ncbi:MAG: YeeE/YedE family protein, partial [Planctomycetes bacterium]|nr:YeeE/YedE family protein [Planctomycetota bacterium]
MTGLIDTLEPRDLLLGGALLVGVVFGLVARLTGFCFRSALLETLARRPGRQVAAWVAALAVAVAGTQALVLAGVVDLAGSIYLATTIAWGGLVVGGLLFGAGMMLTRGCGARHVVLAAGGNLRSWIVLATLGVAAYATLRGILALPRVWLTDTASVAIGAADQGL